MIAQAWTQKLITLLQNSNLSAAELEAIHNDIEKRYGLESVEELTARMNKQHDAECRCYSCVEFRR